MNLFSQHLKMSYNSSYCHGRGYRETSQQSHHGHKSSIVRKVWIWLRRRKCYQYLSWLVIRLLKELFHDKHWCCASPQLRTYISSSRPICDISCNRARTFAPSAMSATSAIDPYDGILATILSNSSDDEIVDSLAYLTPACQVFLELKNGVTINLSQSILSER